ncbi:MAG: methionine aminotransferase [Pseudomonadota bacterium]
MSELARECGALNLSQGFPDYDGPQALREALARHTLEGRNQYAPMAGVLALREQIAAKLERFYSVKANADTEITVVPGATEAIYCAITACLHPGDEAILLDPAYDCYEPAVTLCGGSAKRIPLREPDFTVDWQAVEDAISSRTRLIVINSPHNPTGAVIDRDDLLRLEQLAIEHQLWVISDEVYEHLIFDGRKHHSVLSLPGLRERSFAAFSFGKTFHITGWKTGYCVAPPALTEELRKVHQFVAFVAVTPVQLALADFMEAEPDYAASLADFYQSKRDRLCRALAGSQFRFTPTAGSYFQLLEYSDISRESDTALAERLTREHGIASIPVSVFSAAPLRSHYLRFCFAKTDGVLDQAGEILCGI